MNRCNPTSSNNYQQDDIGNGIYDNMYRFNFENVDGQGGVKEKLQPLPKQQMTVGDFREKVKNNDF